MAKEYLRGIIFLHRIVDNKDFNEVVNCVPDSRMSRLEYGLKKRAEEGEIDMVQIARHRTEIHPLSPVVDQVDAFFAKIDAVQLKPQEECPECGRPYSSTDRATPSEGDENEFTGFDDVNERP